MTRNTKLHRVIIDGKRTNIYYRTLTINEVTFLNNINNKFDKHEQAYKLGVVEGADNDLQFSAIALIGEQIIYNSVKDVDDPSLFSMNINEIRHKMDSDFTFSLISKLLGIFPNVSILDLLNLTYKDLVEMACLAEKMTNKKLFKDSIKKDIITQENHNYFPDDGTSLADKIKQAQQSKI